MQQKDRPLRVSIAADHRDDVGVDRHATAVAAPNREPSQGLHTGVDGRGHRAIVFADGVVLLVAKLEDIRLPALLADARAGNARQPFGTMVPDHDAAPRVDEDHGVVHVVEELGFEDRGLALAAGNGRRSATAVKFQ